QDQRTLVDGGLLNPLPIVPVVSSHSDLIVAVNLNAAGQRHYQLPEIERPPAMRLSLDGLLNRLPFKRNGNGNGNGHAQVPSLPEEAVPEAQQPVAAPLRPGSPRSASGTRVVEQV